MEDIWKNLPEMSAPTPGPEKVVMDQEVCYEGDTSMQSQQENFICILCLKCSGITILPIIDQNLGGRLGSIRRMVGDIYNCC